MTRATRLPLLVITATAATLTLLTGCSTATSSPAATQTITTAAPSTPSATQTATVASTTAPTPRSDSTAPVSSVASTTRTDPHAPAGQCKDSALTVSVQYDPEAAGAGQRGAFVVLSNTGRNSCHLEGTPGLSLVGGGNGTQIGKPAQRNTSDAKLVTIAPGKTAVAQVQYTYVDKNGGNYNDGNGHDIACNARAADGYRVYPPHSYRAYFTATKTYACSTTVRWITVSPVRPAADFPYFTPKA